MDFDVAIIGGGPAGWSAALVLGRCRRKVLVLDDGRYRNAASRALHGFLTRDGVAPEEFLRLAREDALRYDGVRWRRATVLDAARAGDAFELALEGGDRVTARKLLLATGVTDDLPAIAGAEGCYGTSVHHCPYCDGWEHRDEPLAVYGRGDKGVGLALMLTQWSADIVLCTDGPDAEARAQHARLARLGVGLEEASIVRLEGDGQGRLQAVVLEGGRRLERSALFFSTGCRPRSALPERLGCDVHRGAVVAHDRPFEETSVPGVYVAGDASRDLMLVVVAAAEGAKAAFSIDHALLGEDGRL